MPWYRDRAALQFIALGYTPWLLLLNLAWEIAQLPLYALWTEATPSYMAFAVLHCTAGDILIGTSALALVLTVTAEQELARWRWTRVAVLTALAGTAFTAFSEWRNATVLGNWAYSELMPTLEASGVEIGVSPLAQWIVLPPLALYLAIETRRKKNDAFRD
jgi:hypothetical protein